MSEQKLKSASPTGEAPADSTPAQAQAAPPAEKKPVRNKYAERNGKKKKKMPKWLKGLIIFILCAAVIGGAAYLIQSLMKQENTASQGVPAMVTRGRLESTVTGWGAVTPKEKSELGEKVRGTVTEIPVAVGDTVKAGDVIFVVDPEEVQTEYNDALDTLEEANNTLNAARKDLANLTVTAPFKGKLIAVEDLKVGQQLGAGSKVGTLVDDSTMRLSLFYSYGYINDISVGQAATISIPQSMATVSGTVSSVEKIKKVMPEGTVLFKVNFDVPNPGTLTKDMLATAILNGPNGEITPYEAGKLEFSREEEVTARVSGEISISNVHEYYEYNAGATLLSMTSDSLQAALDSAQRAANTAAEKVDELAKSLQDSTQVSPIDGIVTAIMISVGDELKAAGTPLVTISDLSSMIVDINIDEIDVSKVQAGMPVSITYDKTDGQGIIEGTVLSVSFEAKTDSGNGGGGGVAYFPAKISIANNGELMPGMGVNYTISALVKEDCLMVPSSAIVYTESGTVVFAKPMDGVDYPNKVELPEGQTPEGYIALTVEIGMADDKNTEIVSGLEEGWEVYSTAATDEWGMMGGGTVMVG